MTVSLANPSVKRWGIFVFFTLLIFSPIQQLAPQSAAAQILTGPADTDDDGVSNSQEAHDGTDPNGIDSLIEHVGTRYCGDWNGFIPDSMQVMELRNAGCSELGLEIGLRGSGGAVFGGLSRALSPGQQFDAVANGLGGFGPGQYGTLCAEIQSGDPDTLDARMSTYEGISPTSFRAAFSSVAPTARTGSQYVGYNHYFPSLNLSELTNRVEGWVQISSDEITAESGTLVYFDEHGTELKRSDVQLASRGRYDTDSHSIGADTFGSVEWRPTNPAKKFRVAVNRYYLAGPAGSTYKGIIAIPARRPTGKLSASSFRTDSRIAVLELVNTLGIPVTVTAAVFDEAGVATGAQPQPIPIPARGTVHIILNDYLPSGLGKVQFSADQPRSVVSAVLEYRISADGRFQSASVGEPRTGVGVTQRGSYNNYLGGCRLRLVSMGSAAQSQVAVTRSSGAAVTFPSPIQVPANGVVEMDLCASDAPGNYGGVVLTPATSETLVGEIIRENEDRSAAIKTTATERSICSAGLRLDTPVISLTAASGTPGTVMLTNTSTAVTATNIQATLPSGWSDVSVDVSSCVNLAPGASCLLSFTPGTTVHPAASVSVVGSNTSEVLPTVSVDASPTAVISVSGSPLSLTTNGPSDVLTITNTSVTTTATNIASSFVGTALDGNVVESGNTCSTLSPGASCTLSYTPGSTVVAATSFPIQGSNTNAVAASMEIQSGITLISVTPNSGPAAGGAGITLSGTGLTGATGVTFGGVAATSVNVINSTTVTAVTPAHAVGVVDIEITTPGGNATLTNGYTYVSTAVGQSAFGGTIACLNGGLANLIAATSDNGAALAWGGQGIITGASSTTDGAANTATIVAALGANGGTPYAAQICNDFEVDSQGNTPCQAGNTCYNDWFLPAGNNTGASGQLNCLFTNRAAIGSFAPNFYWSSTEIGANDAASQEFSGGLQFGDLKDFTLNDVRCVRAFVP